MRDQDIRETAKTIPKYGVLITMSKEERNVFLIFLDSHLILFLQKKENVMLEAFLDQKKNPPFMINSVPTKESPTP
jgi:hypothetical protein